MSGHDASASSAVVAELSLSFRDEVTACIQSALAVAAEVAVVEVTRLVAHALRDVRDQMHETLRDKQRLESELRVALGRLAEAQEVLNAAQGAPAGAELSPVRAAAGASFCEIKEDGSVCTQDLKPDFTPAKSTSHQVEAAQDMKKDHHSVQENALHFDQVCVEPSPEPGSSLMLEEEEDSVSHKAGSSAPERAVKVEKAERCDDPESGSLTEQEEFGADCLSLAQSRLLEDWRPDALQSCQSNSYISSENNTLADGPVFPGEIPDLDFLTSSAPIQPDPFPAPPRSRRNPSSLSSHAAQQPHSSSSQHVCKICGQSFNRQEDLRRHRNLAHQKQSALHHHHHRGPKRSLFPPGRSPYHCSQCGRDFNRMEHLKIHQRIHTGERPYVCTVCSAQFRHSWALKRHFRIHTGEMPYQCGQCGKTFRNCGGLKFHQRSHARGQIS